MDSQEAAPLVVAVADDEAAPPRPRTTRTTSTSSASPFSDEAAPPRPRTTRTTSTSSASPFSSSSRRTAPLRTSRPPSIQYTMVPASLYLGFTASIIWVGQGTYLTSAARSHAKDCQLHEGTIIGSFNGEFWGMFAAHQVIGNLISLALLRDGKGCFTKHVVTPALGVSGVGGAMAVYGAADVICSFIAGRFTSSLSSITLIVRGGAVLQALILLWLLFGYSLPTGVLCYVYPLLMAALWGVGDGVFNTQLSALLGMLFKHDISFAFFPIIIFYYLIIFIIAFNM